MDRIDELKISIRKLNLLADTKIVCTRCLIECLQEKDFLNLSEPFYDWVKMILITPWMHSLG
jgi:hypothetical protein